MTNHWKTRGDIIAGPVAKYRRRWWQPKLPSVGDAYSMLFDSEEVPTAQLLVTVATERNGRRDYKIRMLVDCIIFADVEHEQEVIRAAVMYPTGPVIRDEEEAKAATVRHARAIADGLQAPHSWTGLLEDFPTGGQLLRPCRTCGTPTDTPARCESWHTTPAR